jgi:hypothetical protein
VQLTVMGTSVGPSGEGVQKQSGSIPPEGSVPERPLSRAS